MQTGACIFHSFEGLTLSSGPCLILMMSVILDAGQCDLHYQECCLTCHSNCLTEWEENLFQWSFLQGVVSPGVMRESEDQLAKLEVHRYLHLQGDLNRS